MVCGADRYRPGRVPRRCGPAQYRQAAGALSRWL
nr:MAG TPA: hypothetical protein [Caudoviricetes sp.]